MILTSCPQNRRDSGLQHNRDTRARGVRTQPSYPDVIIYLQLFAFRPPWLLSTVVCSLNAFHAGTPRNMMCISLCYTGIHASPQIARGSVSSTSACPGGVSSWAISLVSPRFPSQVVTSPCTSWPADTPVCARFISRPGVSVHALTCGELVRVRAYPCMGVKCRPSSTCQAVCRYRHRQWLWKFGELVRSPTMSHHKMSKACVQSRISSYVWKASWGPDYHQSMVIGIAGLALATVLAIGDHCISALQSTKLI